MTDSLLRGEYQEEVGTTMARVLIVEDQKKLLQSLKRGLEEEGYDVITAANGEEGYYLATTGSPDAIVLDLMLPGRDGLKVLRDLRSQGYREASDDPDRPRRSRGSRRRARWRC